MGVYKANPNKDGTTNKLKPYSFRDELPLGHGEKSIFMIERYISLTDQEAMIIRWHMGPYDESYERNANSIKDQFPEAVVFHHADMEASMFSV